MSFFYRISSYDDFEGMGYGLLFIHQWFCSKKNCTETY